MMAQNISAIRKKAHIWVRYSVRIMSVMLIVFIFLTININRDKALQMEIDEQFIFNSIIYEVFIQLGYVGEPRKCLSSKY